MLKLAEIFQSGMVLQRGKPLPVWGTAEPGETVRVTVQGRTAEAAADAHGVWRALLPALDASEYETLAVRCGAERTEVTDAAVGEVWLSGGQSNMEFHMRYEKHLGEVKPNCANPRIRFFDVPEVAFDGQRDCFDYSRMGFWRKAGPEDIEYFCAAGYYFARELEKDLDVPVGIVGCNWGGTVSAAWMDPATVLEAGPEWSEVYEDFAASADWEDYWARQRVSVLNDRGNPFADAFSELLMPPTPAPEEVQAFFASLAASGNIPDVRAGELPVHHIPGALYEHMVKPTAPFAIRGFLWYQGESDDEAGRAHLYERMLTGLIGDWRRLWGDETLPFLVVQLPGFERWLECVNQRYDLIRSAQEAVTKTVPNTFLCSISDAGERFDIHPKDKLVVGERLAKLARGHVYGEDILCDAPTAVQAERDADTVTVRFDHAEGGLVLRGESVSALSVSSEGTSVEYRAEIDGDRLLIRLNGAAGAAVSVDFAKDKFYLVNLYNRAGIPAIPFSFTMQEKQMEARI